MVETDQAMRGLQFGLGEMASLSDRLQRLSDEAPTLDAFAAAATRHLHETLRDRSGAPALALARVFVTHRHDDLPEAQRAWMAQTFDGARTAPDTKCLVLHGTAGDLPEWCQLSGSEGHQAIPLLGEDEVRQIPMIAQLILQLGLELHEVLEPDPELLVELEDRTFNVFHVEQARGSEVIPAQGFVAGHGVRSVLGFGSMLPTGQLAAIILFSKSHISADVSRLFAPLALSLKMAVLPFVDRKIYQRGHDELQEVERLHALNRAQLQLLQVFKITVAEQSARLDGTLQELTDANLVLHDTIEELNDAHKLLVQSEKMAALGQLTAGVAHEVNTPLGAIRASVGNIQEALGGALPALIASVDGLGPSLRPALADLMARSLVERPHTTTRERRRLRRRLRPLLEEHGVKSAEAVADRLVDMGLSEDLEPLLDLLSSHSGPRALDAAEAFHAAQADASNIHLAVERASRVVMALKEFTHFDHTGAASQNSLVELIETVLVLYQSKLKVGIEVVRDYEELPLLSCHPDQLSQVWTNLVHNAIQAMDGRGRLEIGVHRVGDEAQVTFTDDGGGIPEEVLARIFDPFFTTKKRGEGSGLGLHISTRIIEHHHGRIDVASRPGQTTFTVALPLEAS